MSFLKTVGNIAAAAGSAVAEKAKKLHQIKEEFEMKSDEDLKRIADSSGLLGSSADEKKVARHILRERGVIRMQLLRII